MAQFFQGTIQTLANMTQRQQAANLATETPQYQQALFNLMQAKTGALQQKTFMDAIRDAPDDAALLQVLKTYDPQKGLALEEKLIGRRQAGQKQITEFAKAFEGATQEELEDIGVGAVPTEGLASGKIKLRPKQPLVSDPFERARQVGLGSAAAKAETTLNSVKAIVGDVKDVFRNFDEIPTAVRGNILKGGTLGQVAKIVEPSTKAYEDTKELTLANIAKKLGGEVGVLTDRDISRISKALPNVIDPPETVKAKKQFIYNYMDRRVRAYQQTARIPVVGIDMPAEFRDAKLNIDKKQQWEDKIPIKQDTLQTDTTQLDTLETPTSAADWIQDARGGGTL